MCLKSPDYVEMMRSWRETFEVSGKARQRLRLKLKLLRDKLRLWNKGVFGSIKTRKK